MPKRRSLLVRGAAVAGSLTLLLGAAACGDDEDSGSGTVSVIGTWGGAEQEAFLQMVAPFEEETGIKVEYTGTRDINAVLTTGVASGILPDLAGLPGPGQMAEFAQRGALVPLDDVIDIDDLQGRDLARLRRRSAPSTASSTASSSRPPSRA